MAAAYSKVILSGSTNGKGIKISATSIGSGTAVHTAQSGTTDLDEIYLYAANENASGVTRTLTLGLGGTTAVDNTVSVPIPARVGLVPLFEGLPFNNSMAIVAAADVTNEVVIYGYIHRRTTT